MNPRPHFAWVCSTSFGLLLVAALALGIGGHPRAPSVDPRPSGSVEECPNYLELAISDSTFDDSNWSSEFIVNKGAPSWVIDFAIQVNDSEEIDPVTNHYEDPSDPPVRYVRFSRNGDVDSTAYAVVGTLLDRTIVPPGAGFSTIKFEYDNFGSNQPIAPLILQDGHYYQGPKHVASRSLGWHAVSSGCLAISDFTVISEPLEGQLDFMRPMSIGYTLEWDTQQSFALRDHLIDNFRASFDTEVHVVERSGGNRAPVAVPDVKVVRTDQALSVDERIFPLANDVDPDGDTLVVVGHGDPVFGEVHYGRQYFQGPLGFSYRADLPGVVNGPTGDSFTYTISDLQDQSSAPVRIIFDYACWLEDLDENSSASKTQEEFDLTLIRRFRDEAMEPTESGRRWVDYYYNTAPEILKILIVDRTDLARSAVSMVTSLQPAIRSFLDGDGDVPIEQAQVDSISAFFGALHAAGSIRLKRLIDDELALLDPLDDYVGQPVGQVLGSVLGEHVETIAEGVVPPESSGSKLERNFPNPFRQSTRIQYSLSQAGTVSIEVYDVAGRRVRTLADRVESSGSRFEIWDGLNDRGVEAPSGVYLVRLVTANRVDSRTVVLAR